MNNQKYVREKLRSQGWLDSAVSQVLDGLSENDIIQIRNSIAHNLPPNIIKRKGSKSIKELEAELFKGWELKQDADEKALIELFKPSTSESTEFAVSGSYSIGASLRDYTEVKSESERLNELYGRIFLTHTERSENSLYQLRDVYDAYTARINCEEFNANIANLEFQAYLEKILAKIQLEIRSLLKLVTKVIQIDKRTSFRNMLQFLFKNLDDAHSYVNNSLSFLIYYLNITQHDIRKYTRVN